MTASADERPRQRLRRATVSVGALAEAVGGAALRDDDRPIVGIAPLDRAGPDDIAFCAGKKHLPTLEATRAGACFVRHAHADAAPSETAVIVVDDPKRAYALAGLALYQREPAAAADSRMDAFIDATAQVASSSRIAPGVVIGPGAVIGDDVELGAHVVIGPSVVIGAGTRIFPHCSISWAQIGARVTIQAGARIGQAGFGYAGGLDGHVPLPQLGRVVIEDDVDIGANTTIDRGAWDDTVIEKGAKIDNLVHIAHNCRIGAGAILVGQVGVSGSSHIGAFAVLGGQVGVADHVAIGDGAQVGARAGVMRDLAPGGKYLGAPAKPAYAFFREVAALEKLAARRRRGGSDEG